MSSLQRTRALKTAMRMSDLWGDDNAGREAMRTDIQTIPEIQLKDLYEHFVSVYGAFKGRPTGYLKRIKKATA